MPSNLVFTQESARKTDSIVEYLMNELKSKQAAEHFLRDLEEAFSVVCSSPEIYAVSQEPRLKKEGYRPCLFMNYIALYRIDGNKVIVAHIFHSSQDYAKLV